MEDMKSGAAGLPRGSGENLEAFKARSRKLSIADGAFWAVTWGFGESYVAPFAIALKAGNTAMAVFGTVPQLCGALAQLLGASVAERLSTRKPIIVTSVMLQAVGYLPLFAVPYFFPSVSVPAVVLVYTLLVVLNNMAGPSWVGMIGDFVDDDSRGRYFARRNQCVQFVMIIAMLAASYVLSAFKHADRIWLGFCVLFVAAGVARCISAFLMSKLYDAPFNASKEAKFSFIDFVRGTSKSNFAKFTFAVAFINGSTMVAGPFFGVYMLRDLHWSYLHFTLNSVTALAAQALAFPWWGRISDRHGNRAIIRVTSIVLPALPLLWSFTTDFRVLLGVQIFSGIIWSGFSLGISNFVYDSVEPQKRPRLSSYYSLVNGAFSLVGGAVVGSFLANNLPSEYRIGAFHLVFLSSLPGVFVVSGLLRIIAGIIVRSAFKEVRQMEPISTRELLWRVTSGEPIIGQIGDFIALVSSPFLRGYERNTKR